MPAAFLRYFGLKRANHLIFQINEQPSRTLVVTLEEPRVSLEGVEYALLLLPRNNDRLRSTLRATRHDRL